MRHNAVTVAETSDWGDSYTCERSEVSQLTVKHD
jgi:hypothetical protein